MASLGGRLAKVMYGNAVIAGIGEWSMSGLAPEIVETTVIGDTIKSWVNAGVVDAGKVSFSGNYDPNDTAGQSALDALAVSGAELTSLYFYESATVFWRVAAGGTIMLTEARQKKFVKNGLATCSFKGTISGNTMERIDALAPASDSFPYTFPLRFS